MIYESHYWKDELLRIARSLERRRTQKRWPEASFAGVEKSVMLAAYIIRKLAEAKKLSDATVDGAVAITGHGWLGKPVHHLSRLDIDELYDLENPKHVTLSLLKVCHLLIHSYVFMTEFSETNEFDGLFFNSDRTRHQTLYYISISEFVRVLRGAGEDYPAYSQVTYDDTRQDYRFINMREPPRDFA